MRSRVTPRRFGQRGSVSGQQRRTPPRARRVVPVEPQRAARRQPRRLAHRAAGDVDLDHLVEVETAEPGARVEAGFSAIGVEVVEIEQEVVRGRRDDRVEEGGLLERIAEQVVTGAVLHADRRARSPPAPRGRAAPRRRVRGSSAEAAGARPPSRRARWRRGDRCTRESRTRRGRRRSVPASGRGGAVGGRGGAERQPHAVGNEGRAGGGAEREEAAVVAVVATSAPRRRDATWSPAPPRSSRPRPRITPSSRSRKRASGWSAMPTRGGVTSPRFCRSRRHSA